MLELQYQRSIDCCIQRNREGTEGTGIKFYKEKKGKEGLVEESKEAVGLDCRSGLLFPVGTSAKTENP